MGAKFGGNGRGEGVDPGLVHLPRSPVLAVYGEGGHLRARGDYGIYKARALACLPPLHGDFDNRGAWQGADAELLFHFGHRFTGGHMEFVFKVQIFDHAEKALLGAKGGHFVLKPLVPGNVRHLMGGSKGTELHGALIDGRFHGIDERAGRGTKKESRQG